MIRRTLWGRYLSLALVGSAALLSASPPDRDSAQPTHSSPIAITSDDEYVWSVNPDNDSVSVFKVDRSRTKVAEIKVGKEPWCVAITPGRRKVYVTNMASGTVSVINAGAYKVIDTIKVGTEPFGCALTPDGKQAVRHESVLRHRLGDQHQSRQRHRDDPEGRRRSRTASPSAPTARRCSSRSSWR